MWQPDLLLGEIMDFNGLETLVIRALLQNPHEGTRKAMERAFRVICTNKAGQEVKVQFLKLMLKNLPKAEENGGEIMHRCEEFFNLTATLIKSC